MDGEAQEQYSALVEALRNKLKDQAEKLDLYEKQISNLEDKLIEQAEEYADDLEENARAGWNQAIEYLEQKSARALGRGDDKEVASTDALVEQLRRERDKRS